MTLGETRPLLGNASGIVCIRILTVATADGTGVAASPAGSQMEPIGKTCADEYIEDCITRHSGCPPDSQYDFQRFLFQLQI